ncbi:MAG TPA: hypothetical protein VFB66_24005 [Tepidisphaeraceae bacterium]|nr:hypothetical protein [Tepidisphaeraceae bacterium]
MSAVETNWFIAPEKEAKKIAAVVMDDAGEFDAWPNVHLPLGEMELRTLWTAMRGRKVKASESVAAELVFESPNGELFVIKVEPQFLEKAAAIPAADVAKVAAAWAKDEFSGGFSKSELAELVEQIRAFAERALKAGKPVLQLSSV